MQINKTNKTNKIKEDEMTIERIIPEIKKLSKKYNQLNDDIVVNNIINDIKTKFPSVMFFIKEKNSNNIYYTLDKYVTELEYENNINSIFDKYGIKIDSSIFINEINIFSLWYDNNKPNSYDSNQKNKYIINNVYPSLESNYFNIQKDLIKELFNFDCIDLIYVKGVLYLTYNDILKGKETYIILPSTNRNNRTYFNLRDANLPANIKSILTSKYNNFLNSFKDIDINYINDSIILERIPKIVYSFFNVFIDKIKLELDVKLNSHIVDEIDFYSYVLYDGKEYIDTCDKIKLFSNDKSEIARSYYVNDNLPDLFDMTKKYNKKLSKNWYSALIKFGKIGNIENYINDKYNDEKIRKDKLEACKKNNIKYYIVDDTCIRLYCAIIFTFFYADDVSVYAPVVYDQGGSGKSIIGNVISQIFAKSNLSSTIDTSKLSDSKTLYNIYDKRFIYVDEVDEKDNDKIYSSKYLKSFITGGNNIEVSKLYNNSINVDIFLKLLICTNNLPTLRNNAEKRRFIRFYPKQINLLPFVYNASQEIEESNEYIKFEINSKNEYQYIQSDFKKILKNDFDNFLMYCHDCYMDFMAPNKISLMIAKYYDYFDKDIEAAVVNYAKNFDDIINKYFVITGNDADDKLPICMFNKVLIDKNLDTRFVKYINKKYQIDMKKCDNESRIRFNTKVRNYLNNNDKQYYYSCIKPTQDLIDIFKKSKIDLSNLSNHKIKDTENIDQYDIDNIVKEDNE